MIMQLGSGIEIFLQPGEWDFAKQDTRLRTTLGSCVALTLWHPKLRVGGMCHYMLPSRRRGTEILDGRYGEEAMQLLESEANAYRASLKDYVFKVFGGANMFPSIAKCSVASQNINMARQWLSDRGLVASAESVGGYTFRQLVFDIGSGDVWVRQGPGLFAIEQATAKGTSHTL